jgi:hypothetical protein
MFRQSIAALLLACAGNLALAQATAEYEVTITNITAGQSFTPQLVLTHSNQFQIFRLADPASDALAMLAEGGDTGPLTDAAANASTEALTIDGLLGPGQTATTTIMGDPESGFLSIAAMLLPTNDTFVALNRARLPASGAWQRMLRAYDSGTEVNDQSCQHIPGPRCGGEGFSEDAGEGFVHISSGFHYLGEEDADGFEILGPQNYDWRNSVAKVTVRRIN